MHEHLVAYRALGGEQGVAIVVTPLRIRPSWSDCYRQIPGFVTGQYLGHRPGDRIPKENRS